MNAQRTSPHGKTDRRRSRERFIIVGVLVAVASCLFAWAVFAHTGSAGSPPVDVADVAAVTSASPSPEEGTGAVPAGWSRPTSRATAAGSGSSKGVSTAGGTGSSGATAGDLGGSAGGGSSTAGTGSSGAATGGSGGASSADKPANPAALTCTLSIDAETAGRGTIVATRKVSFKAGATVFDVLQRECKAAGIHMEFVYTPMYKSAYIEGIDNLYEFDRGPLSGWMYSVNGWFPNYGCSRYVLKSGDQIRWRYTCDLGKDVGGFYAAEQRSQADN